MRERHGESDSGLQVQAIDWCRERVPSVERTAIVPSSLQPIGNHFGVHRERGGLAAFDRVEVGLPVRTEHGHDRLPVGGDAGARRGDAVALGRQRAALLGRRSRRDRSEFRDPARWRRGGVGFRRAAMPPPERSGPACRGPSGRRSRSDRSRPSDSMTGGRSREPACRPARATAPSLRPGESRETRPAFAHRPSNPVHLPRRSRRRGWCSRLLEMPAARDQSSHERSCLLVEAGAEGDETLARFVLRKKHLARLAKRPPSSCRRSPRPERGRSRSETPHARSG